MVIGRCEDLKGSPGGCVKTDRSAAGFLQQDRACRQFRVEACFCAARRVIIGQTNKPVRGRLYANLHMKWRTISFDSPIRISIAASISDGLQERIRPYFTFTDANDHAR